MILKIKQCPMLVPCVPITILDMVLLRTNPLDPGSEIYEFRLEVVLFAEELTSLSKPDGVTVEQTRIWIRRGSPAMCMKPMRVGDSVKEANEENP